MLGLMSPSTLAGEPPCPAAIGDQASPPASSKALRAVRRAFDTLDARTWDTLAAANAWSTPFSRWALHRAWWDAYGDNAHEETLVLLPADSDDDDDPVAIVRLMHRHEVEPGDVELATKMRHADGPALTSVP